MTREADPTAFTDVLSRSYSHGLEEIYALQDIDIKTVRPLQLPPVTEKKNEELGSEIRCSTSAQISLPLGAEFCGAMTSFILLEPIQVVGLPPHLEAYLHGRGVTTIAELLKEDLTGQKEIAAKAEEYIASRPLYECDRIDCGVWLRAVIGPVQPLKAHIALEPFGLEGLYPLNPHLKVESRRIDERRRGEMAQHTWEQWRGQNVATRFSETLREITDAFIKPWMRQRQGIALEYELQERLERISVNPSMARSVMACFEKQFCGKTFLLERHLPHADKGLYADCLETADAYDQLMEVMKSYFYKDDLVYDFNQLVGYLNRELIRRWNHFDENFVVKALRYSPRFRVRKGINQKLQIWLA